MRIRSQSDLRHRRDSLCSTLLKHEKYVFLSFLSSLDITLVSYKTAQNAMLSRRSEKARMEVGVRIIGIILRILNFLLTPLFWLRTRNSLRVPPIKDPLLMKSATQLAAEIRSGNLTSEDVVSRYISRIQEVNPYINAVVEERYQAALEEAKDIDRKISEARSKGELEQFVADKPLLGVPFTVKESCSLAGLSNSVGCVEHAGRVSLSDGASTARARAAGGVALLVSSTPELCLGWETSSLLHGTTNNPYCLASTPGGSSGGEAALLASGASVVSVSSDIAGSIRIPAAFCGLFGHKPTPGIIPIEGHIPTLEDEQYSQFLTVGPMTRHAEDLTLMMKVLAGAKAPELHLDEPIDLKDLKVYYMTEASNSIALLSVDSRIKKAIHTAVAHLRDNCHATICEEKFKELEDSVEMSVSVFFSMKDIPNMLQDPANPKRSKSLCVETLRLCGGGGSRSLQALAFALLERTRLFITPPRATLHRQRARRLRTHMQRVLGETGVFLYPAHCSPAHAHGAVFVRAAGVAYTMPFNALGLPATALPAGPTRPDVTRTDPTGPARARPALPVSLQVVAGPGRDALCLAVARELEKCFGGWTPP